MWYCFYITAKRFWIIFETLFFKKFKKFKINHTVQSSEFEWFENIVELSSCMPNSFEYLMNIFMRKSKVEECEYLSEAPRLICVYSYLAVCESLRGLSGYCFAHWRKTQKLGVCGCDCKSSGMWPRWQVNRHEATFSVCGTELCNHHGRSEMVYCAKRFTN